MPQVPLYVDGTSSTGNKAAAVSVSLYTIEELTGTALSALFTVVQLYSLFCLYCLPASQYSIKYS
jgi:hypothetical protein